MPCTPLGARLRRSVAATCLLAAFVVTGCATRPPGAPSDARNDFWSGRISLLVQSEPVKSFSASFELKGKPERGELTLISPLGNVLGVLRWSPSEAVLDSGDHKIQRFQSVDALMAQATGAAVPLGALFAWLQGNDASISGWSADLSRHGEGRILAKRSEPLPQADLRVVLDQ